MPLPSITNVLQSQSQDIEKTALYPRQAKIDIPKQPEEKKKVTGRSALFSLLRPAEGTTTTSLASAWTQNKPAANASDILAYWQNVTKASKEEQERLTTRFQTVLKSVRMDGFRQASKARSWPARIFWVLVILGIITVMIYEIFKVIQAYYQSPITTAYTISTPSSMALPTIYICYGNSVNRTFVQNHPDLMAAANAFRNRDAVTKKDKKRPKREAGMSPDQEILDLFKAHARWERNAEEAELEEMEENFRYQRDTGIQGNNGTAGNHSAHANGTAPSQKPGAIDPHVLAMLHSPNISELIYQFYEDAGYLIDETFLECTFDGYQKQKLDCKDIVRRVLDPNYYLCYVIDLPDDMNQTISGKGLNLVLNSHVNLYPRNQKDTPPIYAGLAVSVDKEFDPFNWEKTCVTAGRVTKIDLSLTHVHLEDVDTSSMVQHCYTDDQASGVFQIFNTNYSRTTCQMDCLFQSHRNSCDCLMLVDKAILKDDVANTTEYCSPHIFTECVASLPENDTIQQAVNACVANCFPPCESYRYDMRPSFAKMNEPAYARFQLPENVTYKQLVDLRVSYSRLEYAELIQSPSSSMAGLVSNLGGQINLWMGASLISLLESGFMAFTFMMWSLYTKVIRRIRAKKQEGGENKK